MLVEVAEAGRPPAAEGVVGERHRIAKFTPTMPTCTRLVKSRAVSPSRVKIETPLPYSCSDGSRTALVVFRPDHTQHRAKNLLLVDAHVRRHLVEQEPPMKKPFS